MNILQLDKMNTSLLQYALFTGFSPSKQHSLFILRRLTPYILYNIAQVLVVKFKTSYILALQLLGTFLTITNQYIY